MIIKEFVCGDEGKYFCVIGYYYFNLRIFNWKYSFIFVVFNGKDIFLIVELILKYEKCEKYYYFIY